MTTTYKRTYRLPDNTVTDDVEKYAKAWNDLGERVLKLFPGYTVAGYDPDIIFEFHEIGTVTNTYKVSDRFRLSPRAINALLDGKVPPKVYRDDF